MFLFLYDIHMINDDAGDDLKILTMSFSDLRLNWTLSLKTEKNFIHSKPLQ